MGTSSERIFNGSGKGYLPAGTIGNRTHILSERLKAGTEFKRLKKGHRPAPMPPTWTHILSYKPQSRHFSTSLDAGVQLFGSHGRSWPANCLRRPLDYGCLTPLERFPRGLWSKKGKYEYCYLFSSSDFDHFRNYSTFHSSADDVISPHMFNKSSS